MNCVSCGVSIGSGKNWVKFSCPKCKKTEIIRCEGCKKLENTYKCKDCGFIGP
jgi:predicted RNA-binding Zn-ribbon protein involved in translation (DUF1610 family)